jgi:alkylation response protein AidB-like acyl-CoA dehydrogenase
MPNLVTDAKTKATKVEGGYVLQGGKTFCTNFDAATNWTVSARYEDENGPRVGLFRVDPKATTGLEPKRTWDTLGMRATQSIDIGIEGLFVEESALGHSFPVGHLDGTVARSFLSWGIGTFGAIHTGIAAGAMEYARNWVLERGKQEDPFVQWSFGEMELLLEGARAILSRHADEVQAGLLYDQLGVQETIARAGLSKTIAVNNAVRIFEHVRDVIGGVSYHKKYPIERMWRDVQAGPIMPINNHTTHRLLGASALGVQLAPEIPFAESGNDSVPRERLERSAI